MEIFKIIEEFPKYSISNTGKIKNIKGELMTIGKRKSNSGYLQVRLYHNGKYYYRYIHRLIAIAFLPNPNNYRTINHINGNKEDNRITNLEWASDEMQQRHAFLSGLKNNGISFTREQLFEIYHMYFEQHLYPREIALKLNRPFGTIKKICYGERCKDILREYRDKVKK
jgi:hypothetical protein